MVEALGSSSSAASSTASRNQAEGVTYADKIAPGETRIDWRRPAPEVHNFIRGLSPHPGAWFEMTLNGKTERVRALRSKLVEISGTAGHLARRASHH